MIYHIEEIEKSTSKLTSAVNESSETSSDESNDDAEEMKIGEESKFSTSSGFGMSVVPEDADECTPCSSKKTPHAYTNERVLDRLSEKILEDSMQVNQSFADATEAYKAL